MFDFFIFPHSLEAYQETDTDALLTCYCGSVWRYSYADECFRLDEGNSICELPRFHTKMTELFELLKKFADAR